ncbi:hypothetical protein TI39_contig4119g00036 [Zymoseptoria brevis]|uniref:Uncharacterized protein n=1 Tax=Zymoseptoria brevis TaxID=1047168 RepID=A0A0F4GGJ2_9PEZI|nr:hypothetical protein TI39_contig4119g00036 [Zymoseptoria brevis]
MLNARSLSELLSQNRDERLCRRWYLMTPNGTLLAYSQPSDINDLRKQAAIAAICWQQHALRDAQQASNGDHEDTILQETEQRALEVLTVESAEDNVIMRRVQKQLLLVLEGGVPPRRSHFAKRITAEGPDGTPPGVSEVDRTTADRSGDVATNVLRMQRTKLDILAGAMMAEFQKTGFAMPENTGSMVF